MKRASGEPAKRAAERLCATPSRVFPDSEAPTSPVNNGAIMSVQQARDAMQAFPVDQHALIYAIARAFWDDGWGVGFVRGSRVCPPLEGSPPGTNTLAPLGKRERKR